MRNTQSASISLSLDGVFLVYELIRVCIAPAVESEDRAEAAGADLLILLEARGRY